MPFEYEALVGHLYVVGGRAISAPPPGALVEVAPKKAARGREADCCFTLVLPSGDHAGPATFYERMAALAAEKYFNSSGSVTAGLRSVFNDINKDLHDHNLTNPKKQYEASMICAVLRGNELFVGKVGSAVLLLRHEGQIQSFPEDLSSDDAVFRPPLGVQPIPDIRLTRYTVTSGSRMVLADAPLTELDAEKRSAALASADIAAVLTGFKELVLLSALLVAVEFVPPEAEVPLPVREGQSTAELTAPKTATTELPAVPAQTSSPTDPAAGRRRQRSKSALDDAVESVEIGAKSSASKVAGGAARGISTLNRLIEHFFPAPKEGAKGLLSSSTAMGIVLLLPLGIVALVIFFWLSGTGVSAYEQCVTNVQETAVQARSTTDPTNSRNLWTAVLAALETCTSQRPDFSDPVLETIRREGQDVLDRLDQITRREALPIASFPQARLSQIIMQGSVLYVLDDANDQVYRVQLEGDGLSANSTTPIGDMRRGAVVSGYTVTDIFAIGYDEISTRFVALDRSGVMISCPLQLPQDCTAQQLLQAETWQNPVAVAFYARRGGTLYVLDPGANQIWRYEPTGGVFPNSPTEYFVGTTRPSIELTVDFGIDTNGAIFLLWGDGTLTKWLGEQTQNFGYGGFPNQPPSSATGMFLNATPINPALYIADQTDRVIYQTSQAGTHFATYRTFDESLFALLTDVVADPSTRVIYVVSGNTIFALEGLE